MLRLKTSAALVGSSLVILACGGGDSGSSGGGTNGVSASAYAADVCTALSAWTTSIKDAQKVTNANASGTAAGGKKLLDEYFATLGTASGQLTQAIKAAGTPDVKQGDQAARALQKLGTDMKTEAEDARALVAKLPTSSVQAFTTGATKLQSDVTKALGEVVTGLEAAVKDVSTDELDKAFNNEAKCQG
jgi:hypothetical protein